MLKILQIEDDLSYHLLFKVFIKRNYPQVEIVHVSDGLEGLNLAKKYNFDGIVCDGHLPSLSGDKIVADLRLHNYKGLILANSSSKDSNQQMLIAGADCFFKKEELLKDQGSKVLSYFFSKIYS